MTAAIEAIVRQGRCIPEGNGPVDFDCSGLTSFEWRATGVSLVDYSFAMESDAADSTGGPDHQSLSVSASHW